MSLWNSIFVGFQVWVFHKLGLWSSCMELSPDHRPRAYLCMVVRMSRSANCSIAVNLLIQLIAHRCIYGEGSDRWYAHRTDAWCRQAVFELLWSWSSAARSKLIASGLSKFCKAEIYLLCLAWAKSTACIHESISIVQGPWQSSSLCFWGCCMASEQGIWLLQMTLQIYFKTFVSYLRLEPIVKRDQWE